VQSFCRRAALRACAFLAISIFVLTTFGTALAQATSFLAGNVSADNKPVVDATVTVLGNNLKIQAKTDKRGHFAIAGIPIGTYNIDIVGSEGTSAMTVDVPSDGTTITASLTPLKQIGRSMVTARPPVHGSGTDITLSNTQITHSPAAGNLSALILQMPGAARGANGVVHVNGDHGVIGYVVDGAPVPQELNRQIGGEFDPNDIAYMEVIQGAFPAQYGERFAEILNINTRNGSGPPGFSGDVDYGSFGHADSTLSYHAPVGKGYLEVAARNELGNRGEDPPNLNSPHNKFSDTNQFLRYTLPVGKDYLNLTVSNSYHTYQIPNDVNGFEPASTNDNETQADFFSNLQYRHPISDHGSLSVGTFYKRSTIRDYGDPTNDFIYGASRAAGQNVAGLTPAQASAMGIGSDCANGITANPGGGYTQDPNYTNGSCGYSLYGNRTAIDIGGNLDYVNRSPHHAVAFGGLYDATHVSKDYQVTLQGYAQGGNFLTNTGLCPQVNPDGSCTVTDNAPNIGHLSAAYLQDSWKMSDHWQVDYGVRQDLFQITSTEFQRSYSQTSPRLKVTYSFSPYANVYAYYGRLFMPYSLENVSPTAAYMLNLPLQNSIAAFDLKPQRISDYEIGGHFAVGRNGDIGVRVMQQNSTDWIDDTQVGVTNLHQDVNYAQGRVASQSLYYQASLAGGSRFYASATHTFAVDKGCETQLLAPCFGAGTDWVPADHDQRVDINAGIIKNDSHGGWFSFDGEYGSGLSTQSPFPGLTSCGGPNGTLGGPCKVPPHLTFDAEKGFGVGHGNAIVVRIQNLLNDRYMVTYLNAQGNHWALPRSFDIGYRFGTSR
jgi:hypothetical protein